MSGARLHREGNLAEAETTFRTVIGLDPKNVDAFYNLGALAEGRGDLVTALSHYRAAQALRPDDLQIGEAVKSTEQALTIKGAAPQPNYRFNTSQYPGAPMIGLPSSVDPPITTDGQVFQLSSNKNATSPPVVGVQSMSQPVQNLPVSPPVIQPVTPPAGRGPSVGRAIARQTLNMAASYALRGTGLHCPICHFLRF